MLYASHKIEFGRSAEAKKKKKKRPKGAQDLDFDQFTMSISFLAKHHSLHIMRLSSNTFLTNLYIVTLGYISNCFVQNRRRW